VTVFYFDSRSLVPRAQKKGLETGRNVLKISNAETLAIGQAWWLLDASESSPLWSSRFDRLIKLPKNAARRDPCTPVF
jgi:hypothetical protein